MYVFTVQTKKNTNLDNCIHLDKYLIHLVIRDVVGEIVLGKWYWIDGAGDMVLGKHCWVGGTRNGLVSVDMTHGAIYMVLWT